MLRGWRTAARRLARGRAHDARSQAEAVLRETRQFYIALDASGTVLAWNRAAEKIFGYSADEALGSALEALIVPPASREAHRRGLETHRRTGRGRGIDTTIEVQARHADGSELPVELTIWAQVTPDGHVFHALGSDLTERRTHERVLRLLAEHRRRLLHAGTPEDVHRLLAEAALRGARCDAAWSYVVAPDEAPGTLRLSAQAPATAPDGPALLRADRAGDDLLGTVRRQLPHGVRSAALLPVLVDGDEAGLLVLGWTAEDRQLTGSTADLLDLLAAEASTVLLRLDLQARLQAAARTDSLTGLANRRAFDETLARELTRGQREGSGLSLVLVDLDSFKAYNDRHGHPAGDDLLRGVAAAWSRAVRAPDVLARVGGDEFALVLPGADCTAASTALDRLVAATPDGVALSAGIASTTGGDDAGTLMQRADQALYEAKRRR